MIDDLLNRIGALMRSTQAPSFGLGMRFAVFDRVRLAAALLGVAVAVLVMFVELGLLDSILSSQARVATLIQGDLVVMSRERTNLHEWARIDRIRMAQIGRFDGVSDVIPIYSGGMLLRNPPDVSVHRIIAYAFPADSLPLAIGDAAAISNALKRTNTVLYDRLSRPIYGPMETGRSILLDGRQYQVGGQVEMGPDIIADGAVIMSEGAWLSLEPGAQPIMGVVRLRPGADADAVRERIATQMPADTQVMTPREAHAREVQFTLRSAPIGIIFGIGLAAGVVIGAIICYQILFNEIIDHAKEYATLRAMGFPEVFFRRIVFEQAVLLVFGGFVVGLLAALVTARFLTLGTGMAVEFGFSSIAFVALPAAGMAFLAAALASRHLAAIDPADLY